MLRKGLFLRYVRENPGYFDLLVSRMVAQARVELATPASSGQRSTDELPGHDCASILSYFLFLSSIEAWLSSHLFNHLYHIFHRHSRFLPAISKIHHGFPALLSFREFL